MKSQIRKIAIVASVLAAITVVVSGSDIATAKTPDNMLVMAKNISDIITLDPAETFEFSGGEVIANIYDRVMMFEPEDLTKLVGGVAESYTVSNDGKTVTLKIRPGQTFHSGNPLTAKDVAYSLQRVLKLEKTPAFILTQFGWSKDNADKLIKATDNMTVSLTYTADFSPGLLLNALSAGVGSVVDMKLVQSHEKDGDMGYGWLKNHSAGSGPFELKTWKANELVSLEANPNYRHGAPKLKRVAIRHIPEPSAQRLLIEKGDADIVRNLTPDQIKGLAGNPDITVHDYPKAALMYMVTNDKNKILSNPKVRMAMRYLVDYKGMEQSFLSGQYMIHQAFWPSGLWAGLNDNPFSLDIPKAKAMLADAGYEKGFDIKIDTLNETPFKEVAQSVQQTLGKVGIKASITLSEGKTLWPKYRARKHEILIARWSPDYVDPHSNADSFAHNPDNRDEAKLTGKLAWRTGWSDPKVNALTEQAAKELDLTKREKLYLEDQRAVQMESPFTVMFQQNEQVASSKNVKGFVSGANFDLIFYRNVSK